MINPAYIAVGLIGLLHGFEPGHGWPMAVLYSMKRSNSVFSATVSSLVIGAGHLVSSVAVVLAYVLLQSWLDFSAPWLKYVAAALLVFLAVKLFREKVDAQQAQHGHIHPGQPEVEHEHEHEHPGEGRHNHTHKHGAAAVLSLLGLASFAFVLGFAHEEELALLALVAGGLNAWALMLTYGLAVMAGLTLVTIVGVKVYERFQPRLARYERYVPRAGAVLLAIMAAIIVLT